MGSIPIVDDHNKLLGIVSEFDLLGALRRGKKLEDVSAGEILTANPVSVTKDTDVMTLVDVLQNNHLIRVPVLDNKGCLIGIVARRDLLRGYLHASGVEAPRGVVLPAFPHLFFLLLTHS